jgi:hypothetical protein
MKLSLEYKAEAIDSLIESGWIEELEGKLKIKGSVFNTDR